MAGAVALLTACLAQAASLPLPWCADADVRHTAMSADHHWILALDSVQQSLTLFDDQANPVRHYALAAHDGKRPSAVQLIVDATPRHSFIVVFNDMPEVWEISYDLNAGPIFDGLVHDYRMGEGLARPGFLGLRRTLLRAALAEPYFTADYRTVISMAKNADRGSGAQARIVNLDVHQEIATATLAVWPEQGASFAVSADGRTWHAIQPKPPVPESIKRLMRNCAP
jgi:hypothetical protein